MDKKPAKSSKYYITTIILLIYLLIPNIYLAFHGSDFVLASFFKIFLFLLLSFLLLCIPLLFLRPKVLFIIGIIFAVLAPFEIVNIYLFKASINAGIIFSVINTTPKEAIELLRGILPLSILGFSYIGFYIYFVIKYIPLSFRIKNKIKLYLGILFIISLLLVWIHDKWISIKSIKSEYSQKIFWEGTNNFNTDFGKIFPYSSIIQTKKTLVNISKMNAYKHHLINFQFYATKKDQLNYAEKYVLVIGEASRRNNWQLYGYKRRTDPLLSKNKKLVLLSDFASTADVTDISIPLILSRATPDSFCISYKEKTIVSAFKESGFKTYWISNQGIFNSDLSRFTNDVDKIYNLNNKIDFAGNYDEHIFPYIDSILSKNDKKQFIVINLMGSHFRYNFRYPEKFNVFKPGFNGASDYMMISPKNKEKLVNIYDNSILYSDYILSEIIRKFEKTTSLSYVFFLSDHGENLYDDKSERFGHASESPSKYEIQVPFIIWTSNLYDSVYSQKMTGLKLNKDKRTSTSNLFYSLLDAANIGFRNERSEKSIFSNNFKEDSVRKVIVPSMKVVIFDRK